jgi:hypothetical protein
VPAFSNASPMIFLPALRLVESARQYKKLLDRENYWLVDPNEYS